MRTHAHLVFLLAASAAWTPRAAARVAGEPPPGTQEDRGLWIALRDVAGEAEIAMARVGRCAYRLRYGGYREGLETAAREVPGAKAEGARRLREELDRLSAEAQAAIPPDGGRVRSCRYTLLDLEQRMDEPPDAPVARELPGIRAEGRRCVERLRKLVEVVRPAADALEAKLREIDLFLGRRAV